MIFPDCNTNILIVFLFTYLDFPSWCGFQWRWPSSSRIRFSFMCLWTSWSPLCEVISIQRGPRICQQLCCELFWSLLPVRIDSQYLKCSNYHRILFHSPAGHLYSQSRLHYLAGRSRQQLSFGPNCTTHNWSYYILQRWLWTLQLDAMEGRFNPDLWTLWLCVWHLGQLSSNPERQNPLSLIEISESKTEPG